LCSCQDQNSFDKFLNRFVPFGGYREKREKMEAEFAENDKNWPTSTWYG
jgi:hypothetical protein